MRYLFLFFVLLMSTHLQAQETLKAEDFCIESIAIDSTQADMLVVTVYNKGRFISYPVIKVLKEGNVFANKEGRFYTYGQGEHSRWTYYLPTKLKKIPENTQLTVLLSEGHSTQALTLAYPCTETLDEED